MQRIPVGATSKLAWVNVHLCIPTLAYKSPVFRPDLIMYTLSPVHVSERCLQ
jgi:hypothetical protein